MIRTDENGAPDELWLQLYGDDHESGPVDCTNDNVTWCWERIFASDVRYIRADLVQEGIDRAAAAGPRTLRQTVDAIRNMDIAWPQDPLGEIAKIEERHRALAMDDLQRLGQEAEQS